MDLLAKRYANPFLMLDQFIRLNQLHDFICDVLKIIADEKIQDARWQYYLHRVSDMSYEEYVRACNEKKTAQENKQMTDADVQNVIIDSKNMLDGFIPE